MFEHDDDLDADIERLVTVQRNRRELGWSYYGLISGGGHQIGQYPLTVAERVRRHRAGQSTPRKHSP